MPQSRMSQFMQQFGRPQSGNPWGQFQRPQPPQRPGPFPGYGINPPQIPQPGMPPMKPGMPPQQGQPPMGGGGPPMGHMGPGSMPMPQQRNPMMAQQAQANMLRRY